MGLLYFRLAVIELLAIFALASMCLAPAGAAFLLEFFANACVDLILLY